MYRALLDADIRDPAGNVILVIFEDEDTPATRVETAEWMRLVVRHDDRDQDTIGSPDTGDKRRFKSTGRVIVQIFTAGRAPAAAIATTAGAQRSDELALAVRNVFDAKRIETDDGSVIMLAARTREGGRDGEWNHNIVEAEFNYEDRA